MSIPDAVPTAAVGVIRESLAGAVTTVDSLPAASAADVLGPAREAFTSGLQVAALVGAVLFIAMALLVSVVFRPRVSRYRPADTRLEEQEISLLPPTAPYSVISVIYLTPYTRLLSR